MKTTISKLLGLIATAAAFMLPTSLPAAFIQTGNGYSYEVSSAEPAVQSFASGIFSLNIPAFYETLLPGGRTYSNEVSVTFRADPGKIVSQIGFSGSGGAFNNFGASGGDSRYDWSLSSGAYSGAVGTNTGVYTYYNRYAEITGPRSGSLLDGRHFWFSYGAYDFNDPFFIPGHFNIGASQVDLNVVMNAHSYNGGYFASQALRVVVSVIDAPAPPPASVPDSGTTAILMGVGLLGLAATRRRLRFA